MKPMLERKRRARINKCLDELKDLMVHALQSEGESISKLEKADVLELTVSHLRKLKRQQMLTLNPHMELDRFQAGYAACATEVERVLANQPGVDLALGARLMAQLGHRMDPAQAKPLSVRVPVPTYPTHSRVPEMSPTSDLDLGYNSGRESSPSPRSSSSTSPSSPNPSPAAVVTDTPVWRPF